MKLLGGYFRKHAGLIPYVIVALAAALGIYRVESTVDKVDRASKQICEVSADSREALRVVLVSARDQGLASVQDEKTKNRIRDFYEPLLNVIPVIECIDGKPVEVR